MFVNPSLGWIVCFWLIVFQPITQSIEILDNPQRTKRWFTFYICVSTIVLPLLCILPYWCPFRYEIFIAILTCLSSSDAGGAYGIYINVITPRVAQFTVSVSKLKDITTVQSVAANDRVDPVDVDE